MNLEDLLGGELNAIPPMDTTGDIDQDVPDDFLEITDDEEEFDEQAEAPDFQENLAESLDDSYLDTIANELMGLVEDDLLTRQPWMDMIEKTKMMIGIGEDSSYEEPFPGSSSVIYPIITKAQIQFQSRALPEIFPNNPANAVVVGESNPLLEEQAERVKDTINYQITYLDRGNKPDFKKMLWWLPLTGSCFRYVFHDPITNTNRVRFVPVEDFIVPYGTSSLEDAPHFAHRIHDSKNTIKKLMRNGFYREVDIFESSPDDGENSKNIPQTIRDDADGKMQTTENVKTLPFSSYLIYTDYDLAGFEDIDEETGEETGIGLPYVFTIDCNTNKILAIRRNWKEDDELKQKRIFYAHYQYQEGPGFYGSGLAHLIGSLQEAATGALRAYGDAMAFAMLKGGFKSKDAKIAGSDVMTPGVFQDIDLMGGDDINKFIKELNFTAPSPNVINYIQMLDSQAQTIVSTQDIMTGDSNPVNAPVGSTLAMIEQAQKVISAQHKSLYESFSDELQILSELNYDFLPDEDYFKIPGKVGAIRRADFDDQVDVMPTADPSVASFQQRQAIDQATMQLFQVPEFQQYAKDQGYPLLERLLKNLNVPSVGEILISPEELEQKRAQEAQNPPPPPPEVITAQARMTEAQTRAKQAEADSAFKEKELEIKDHDMLIGHSLTAEEIDLKYLGAVNPLLQSAADNMAIEGLGGDVNLTGPQNPGPVNIPQEQEPLTQQAPADPEKRNILMRLMDKVRGN